MTPGTASFHVGRGHAHFVERRHHGGHRRLHGGHPAQSQGAPARSIVAASPTAGPADLEHAIEDYTAAVTLNPIYALAYNNRGYVYEAQGRKDDAIADFQTALLLDPSLIGARDGLKRLGLPNAARLADRASRAGGQGAGGKELQSVPCGTGTVGASPNRKAPKVPQSACAASEPGPARATVARDF